MSTAERKQDSSHSNACSKNAYQEDAKRSISVQGTETELGFEFQYSDSRAKLLQHWFSNLACFRLTQNAVETIYIAHARFPDSVGYR